MNRRCGIQKSSNGIWLNSSCTIIFFLLIEILGAAICWNHVGSWASCPGPRPHRISVCSKSGTDIPYFLNVSVAGSGTEVDVAAPDWAVAN